MQETSKFITTSEITEITRELATENEADVDLDKITTRRMGWILKKLRLRAGRNSARTKRGWELTGRDLALLRRRYGLTEFERMSETSETSEREIEMSDSIELAEAEAIRLEASIFSASDSSEPQDEG